MKPIRTCPNRTYHFPESDPWYHTSLYVMTRVLRNVLDSEDKYSTDQLVLPTTGALPRILTCDNSDTDTDRLQ